MGKLSILAPIAGKILSLKEVKDPVFSNYMMGVGIAIKAKEGIIKAPIAGVITHIAETNHAIIISYDGINLMIHVGIDTCKLKGNGFTILVDEGDYISKNQDLMKVDFSYIEKQQIGNEVILVILENNNMDIIKETSIFVEQGDVILEV